MIGEIGPAPRRGLAPLEAVSLSLWFLAWLGTAGIAVLGWLDLQLAESAPQQAAAAAIAAFEIVALYVFARAFDEAFRVHRRGP